MYYILIFVGLSFLPPVQRFVERITGGWVKAEFLPWLALSKGFIVSFFMISPRAIAVSAWSAPVSTRFDSKMLA